MVGALGSDFLIFGHRLFQHVSNTQTDDLFQELSPGHLFCLKFLTLHTGAWHMLADGKENNARGGSDFV